MTGSSPYRMTVLTPQGSGLARKFIYADGTIRGADKIRQFRHRSEDVSTPEKLLEVIRTIAGENALVIRGEPACDRQPLLRQKAHERDRGDEGFVETPRAWLSLDIDGLKLPAMTDWREGVEPVIEYAVGLLPEAFHDARMVWQFTSSHGLERRTDGRWTGGYVGDVARLRLWVLLARPIGEEIAVAWTAAMAGPLALDIAIQRTVQMNYTARPLTEAGADPLQPFIDRGIPVVGMRDGLDDYVVVPQGIEVEARWVRAEGRSIQCASHPSAEAAIAAIGRPTQDGGRGEIRSHLWAAARHLIRAEQHAQRAPVAGGVAETIRAQVMAKKDAIEANLMAHGRTWAEVLAYVSTYQIESICDWLISQPADLRGGDGGGKRKTIRRVLNPTYSTDSTINVVPLDEISDKCVSEIGQFIHSHVRDYWTAVASYSPEETDTFGNPIVPHPVPPRRMLAVSTGAGKTEAAIGGALDYIAAERAAGGARAVYIAVPHHKLSDELVGRVTAQAARRGMTVKAAVWRGRTQPDPLQPDVGMCQRQDDLETVKRYMLSVSETLCASGTGENKVECQLAGICGYTRQAREAADADIVIVAHSLMTNRLPRSLPKPGIAFVDEAAWQIAAGGGKAAMKIGTEALRRKSKTSPDLDWARRDLAKLIDEEDDGGLRAEALLSLRESMGAMGISPGTAAKLEYEAVGKLQTTVVHFTGGDLESALKRALGDAKGIMAARRMAALWRAVDDAVQLPAGARSGRLELVTDRKTGDREVQVRWKEELAEVWNKVPIMFLDATADATVLEACFSGIVPSPRLVSHNPNVRLRQIADRSMSHAAIAPKTAEDISQRNNAAKVKAKLISDALQRYPGQRVVVVVPAATEKVWREGPIPSWLTVLHHGAITGLDNYGKVRAVYVVGRPLPPSSAVEAMAGAITGVEPAMKGYRETKRELVCVDGSGVVVTAWEHPDPLCEAIRRQITEAGIIQAAGRGRGTNRTAETPLDLILWSDVAVPELGFVEAETWVGPSVEEEMLAAGCWLDLPADAARVHPKIISSPAALKQARHRTGSDISLWRTSISKCHHPWRYRPKALTRTTTGTAVFLSDLTEQEARAYLEAHLGPLAMLERLTPAPEAEVAVQVPLQAPAESVDRPIEVPPPPTPIEIRRASSVDLKPILPPSTDEDDLATYTGGILPPSLIAKTRALQAALGLNQEGMADLIGISRSHLANAQQGRFSLSPPVAARLIALLRHPPPTRQPDLFSTVQ